MNPQTSQQTTISQKARETIDRLNLHGFEYIGERIERWPAHICLKRNDAQVWVVEVTLNGLVSTQGSGKQPVDFFTWQLHHQSRLLYTEAE